MTIQEIINSVQGFAEKASSQEISVSELLTLAQNNWQFLIYAYIALTLIGGWKITRRVNQKEIKKSVEKKKMDYEWSGLDTTLSLVTIGSAPVWVPVVVAHKILTPVVVKTGRTTAKVLDLKGERLRA